MNRVWAAIKRETLNVLSEGVTTPEVFDAAYKGLWRIREGPCRMMDLVGRDTVAHIEEYYVKDRNLPRAHLDWLEDNFIQAGRLGKKSDQGGSRGRERSYISLTLVWHRACKVSHRYRKPFAKAKFLATSLMRVVSR